MSTTVNLKAVITADDQASAAFKKVGNAAEDLGNRTAKFIGGAATQAATVAAAGFAALTGAAYSCIKSFEESEAVAAQQTAVLESTGHAAGVTAEQLNEQAKALQKVTKFSDEDVGSVQNLLLTFTSLKGPILQGATETVLDMATALGEDTKSASIQLGKALQDPINGITALRRVGVNFSDKQKDVIQKLVDTGKVAEAQKLIMKELATEFGGSAKAAGETFAGRLVILGNRIDDIKENIGDLLLYYLDPLVEWFDNFVSNFDADTVFTVFGNALIQAQEKVTAFLAPIISFVTAHKAAILEFLGDFAKALLYIIPILGSIALVVGVLSSPLVQLGLIVAAATMAWNHMSETVRDIVLPVLGGLVTAIATLIITMKIQAAVESFVAGMTALKLAVAGTTASVGFLSTAISLLPLTIVIAFAAAGIIAVLEAVKKLQDALNELDKSEQRVRDTDNDLIKKIQELRQQPQSAERDRLIAGYEKALSIKAPPRAEGGQVIAGRVYTVGEHGPERFVPGASGQIIPNGQSFGGHQISIHMGNVNVRSQKDIEDIGAAISRHIQLVQKGAA